MDLKLEQRRGDGFTCVYCRDAVEDETERRECPDCQVCFHDECWRALRRCSTPGCAGKPELVVTPDADAPKPVPKVKVPPPKRRGIVLAEPQQVDGLPSMLDDLSGRMWERMRPTQRGLFLSKYGMAIGLTLGVLIGLVGWFVFPRHGLGPFGRIGWPLLWLPTTLACGGLGFLQGLLGTPVPQPEGGGFATGFLVFVVAAVTLGTVGPWLAIPASIVTLLLGGRLFGFNVTYGPRRRW